jgi:hypothetical protein
MDLSQVLPLGFCRVKSGMYTFFVDERYFDVTFVCASLWDDWWAMRNIASCGYTIHSSGGFENRAATAQAMDSTSLLYTICTFLIEL